MRDTSLLSIQSAHTTPTPRLGGLAIILTFCVFGLTNETLPLAILFSLIPIIIIGFTEDIYLNISPKYRLIIAALSGLYTVLFFSGPITHIDFLPLKWVFEYHIIATGFTVFAIVGMVNAVNMIDGLNGFSGFQSLAMLSAISFIAYNLENYQVYNLSIILIFSILGFLLLNFPFGKIFMGDTGAYAIGFIIAALAIRLHNYHPEISSWAILLIVFWPVCDLLLSVYRRIIRRLDTKQPDFMHYHHVVLRTIKLLAPQGFFSSNANPLATVIITPVSCLPAFTAVVFYADPIKCFLAVLILGFLFLFGYITIVRFALKSR